MNYYFPSLITSLDFSKGKLPDSFLSVNSGENAIRLLLRSYKLGPQSKVALPSYVCDSLKEAVRRENLEPLYLDLKPDGTFFSDYSTDFFLIEKPAVVILVHLYGFIHPDTNRIMEFCKQENIYLMHDAAQSYGIDEASLTYSSGIVYSFGPGKSSTAARGAYVKGLNEKFYGENCKRVADFSIQGFKAKLFLQSRMYGYKFSLIDKFKQKIVSHLRENDSIKEMTGFQLEAAATAMQLVKNKSKERRERYQLLEEAVKANTLLSVPFNDGKGLYFKIIMNVKQDVLKFKTYLRKNNIPYFSLIDEVVLDKNKASRFPVFSKNANCFVELSSEASIPLEEIKRIAEIISKYS